MTDAWTTRLLDWYQKHRRPMPWRAEPSPYRVWISEIMLQQTQVETVIPYFERFLAAFPDVHALAAADQQQVLKLWQGLGYYARARRLHATAKLLVDDYDGKLPQTYDELLALPGFGPYTAAAVASIAFGQAVPVVDGNVLRVFSRFWALEDDIAKPKARTAMFEHLQAPIAEADPSSFNQAIMELGALVCRPTSPGCLLCPLQPDCIAANTGRVDELPVKSSRKPIPHHRIAVAYLEQDGAICVVQRPEDGMLGGLWELPGGRCEEGETLSDGVSRQVERTTGLAIIPGEQRGTIRHGFSHFTIEVHIFDAKVTGGRPANGTWLPREKLHSVPFSRVTMKILDQLDLNPS